jgi:hypothetical protein
MSLKTKLGGEVLAKVIANVQKSEPRTTLLGTVLAGAVASQIDYPALLTGNSTEIAKLVSVFVVQILAYYTNHSTVIAQAAREGPAEHPAIVTKA